MKEYTACIERCRFAFKNCGRRCAEDHIRCRVLPLGGEQQVTPLSPPPTRREQLCHSFCSNKPQQHR
jgi:hypothetical protein